MLHCRILSLSALRPANVRFLSSIVWLVKTHGKCRSVVLHPPCRSCYYTISDLRRLRLNDRTGTHLFRRIWGRLLFFSYWNVIWCAYINLLSRYGKTIPPVLHDVSDLWSFLFQEGMNKLHLLLVNLSTLHHLFKEEDWFTPWVLNSYFSRYPPSMLIKINVNIFSFVCNSLGI